MELVKTLNRTEFGLFTFDEMVLPVPGVCAGNGKGKDTADADSISDEVEGDDALSERADEIDEKKSWNSCVA
jgi:hypothetical protein